MLGIRKHDLMLNAPKTTKTAPPQAVAKTAPMPCGPGKSADSPTIICDLADSDAFVETYSRHHFYDAIAVTITTTANHRHRG